MPIEQRLNAAATPAGGGHTVVRSAAPAPAPVAVPMADHCQVGAVLRSVLFVEAVVAIGALVGVDSVSSWLLQFAAATSVALPGVLLWQVAACGLQRFERGWTASAQVATAAVLGAVAALTATGLHAYALDEAVSRQGVLLPMVAGACMAALTQELLRLRALALGPAQAEARLAELQSRIRPHFLFNALNTALSLVRDEPRRAEGVIEDLAELFRGALADDGGGRRTVSLGEEVTLAQRYIAIEQIRFGERLRIAWSLDPAAEAARLPPLLLQPLLENAVRHGVEGAAEGGSVQVRTAARRGQAVVTVINTVPAIATARPGHGIALRNVRERLRLLHDVAAEFEAGAADGTYTVRIAVPLAA